MYHPSKYVGVLSRIRFESFSLFLERKVLNDLLDEASLYLGYKLLSFILHSSYGNSSTLKLKNIVHKAREQRLQGYSLNMGGSGPLLSTALFPYIIQARRRALSFPAQSIRTMRRDILPPGEYTIGAKDCEIITILTKIWGGRSL
jgi:hypothetical protein